MLESTPPSAKPRALPLPGEFLGPYRLISELASGGMASIYLALANRRSGVNRLVAVKRLHRHLTQDPDHRQMFLDEARIASQIRHPNVCTVLDYDAQDGTPYIVMEYLAGEPVSAIWKLHQHHSPSETQRWARVVARIAADVCEALHAAHELRSPEGELLNVVHRDVSPENIVVTYDGVVKLCDFGIAIAEGQEHRTEAGMLKGKYSYIQPEVLRGQRPDRRSDIWSLGVVLWELLTGERLFHRATPLETLQAVSEALVAAPSAVLADLPPELDAVVLRALSSDPDERFATARDFGKALNLAIASAGRHVGLGDIAEWMGDIFQGGRARRDQLIESVERLYEPPDTNPWTQLASDDTEAQTLAIESPKSVPPVAMIFSQRSVVHPRLEGEDPKRRRPLVAFALGAVLSAGFLSPNRSIPSVDERDADASKARVALATIVSHGQGVDAPLPGEVAVLDSGSSDQEIASSMLIREAAEVLPEQKRRTERKWSSSRGTLRRPGSPVAREFFASNRFVSGAIPAVRPLELGPAFTAYASVLLRPPVLLVAGRAVPVEPPRSTASAPSSTSPPLAGQLAVVGVKPSSRSLLR